MKYSLSHPDLVNPAQIPTPVAREAFAPPYTGAVANELGVRYDLETAELRVRQARRALIWGLATPVAVAAIYILLWLTVLQAASSLVPWLLTFLVGSAVLGTVMNVVRLRVVLKDTVRANTVAQANAGFVLWANRGGVMVGPNWFGWTDVAKMSLKPGRLGGSDRLIVTARDGSSNWLPLAYTDAGLGRLDQAVRALSGGRVGIDWSLLDV